MHQRLLNIYLNDHLAGATAGVELARRCRSSNSGKPLENCLTGLIADIESDRAQLETLMSALGTPQDRFKLKAAWLAEKVDRLKLNGQIKGYSPLSQLIELEGLRVGIEAKRSLWQTLKEVENIDFRLATADLDLLIKRADEQLEAIEPHRTQAARTAFA